MPFFHSRLRTESILSFDIPSRISKYSKTLMLFTKRLKSKGIHQANTQAVKFDLQQALNLEGIAEHTICTTSNEYPIAPRKNKTSCKNLGCNANFWSNFGLKPTHFWQRYEATKTSRQTMRHIVFNYEVMMFPLNRKNVLNNIP
ncbi:uncharacterized protein PHALS_12885 [Plasmopara halstedii]|uniref:Uncharacterized protein n=1 Tax=Plasmopara halstedii TaxID=4781 RepID=A0A0P1AP59_PLAHL|nr:uncharacterized protein PHALS_12885 [Plasmopara halstedii]CEG42625.1 hypothetical protein PHALS_12885 [Plasmopara halstedii]|eukprot:XP_024578994.1 hypothetical protein PHALS_12885 [Plasmopara halstedii]